MDNRSNIIVGSDDGLDAYSSLTSGAVVTWDTSTGLNKTLIIGGDFTLDLTNLVDGMSGDLRLYITSTTTITLPTSGLNGSVESLSIGIYHLAFVYDGTDLDFNIMLYEYVGVTTTTTTLAPTTTTTTTTTAAPVPKDYGYLYNGYAVNHVDFAPTDWRVPTDADYSTLKSTLGGWQIAGGPMKESGTAHWDSPNSGGNNSSNFTAFGSGHRDSSDGGFRFERQRFNAWLSGIAYYNIVLHHTDAEALKDIGGDAREGVSVRLIYTGGGTPTTMTDEDGNVYDVVLIGSQYWTKQNWKCTKLNDSTPLTKGGFDPNFFTNLEWSLLTTEGYCPYDNDENNV